MKKDSTHDWASEVKALRAALDLTQEEFAIKIGKAGSTIGYWESGKVTPHKRTMARVRDICIGAAATSSGPAEAAVGKRRYSDETVASLHRALDSILDSAPGAMVKDVSAYLIKCAGYYGGTPEHPGHQTVREKDKK